MCRYTWTYQGHGATAVWQAARSYTVVDLSAGPTRFGPLAAAAGAVRRSSVPSILQLFAAARAAAARSPLAPPADGSDPPPVTADSRRGRITNLRASLLQVRCSLFSCYLFRVCGPENGTPLPITGDVRASLLQRRSLSFWSF